jgi:hypothetical protein
MCNYLINIKVNNKSDIKKNSIQIQRLVVVFESE